jgi:flagellar export protein FliJ
MRYRLSMAFRFSLAAVLKLRQSLEQQEYFKLLKLQQEITNIEGEIHQTEEQELQAEVGRTLELAHGLPAGHLQDSYEKSLAWTRLRETLKLKLKETEARRRQQLVTYRTVRQGREILEKIRERQHSEYIRDRNKRQQALIDDLFLSHFKRDD